MVKTIYWLQHAKKSRSRKKIMTKMEKCCTNIWAMLHTKKMENLKPIIDVKLVNNKKDYLKCTSKPSYMSNKLFDNNLVVIRKSKLALKLNKPAYSGICILELSKVTLECTNSIMIILKINMTTDQSCDSQTNSLIYEIKTEDVYEGFSWVLLSLNFFINSASNVA